MWRGSLPGATRIASKRISRIVVAADGRRARLPPPRRCGAADARSADSAASSSVSRAFTSTNTSKCERRRATMSISPTGDFQRRARMRKPLAIRNAAARLSAEMPTRKATIFSGRASRFCRSGRGAGLTERRRRARRAAAIARHRRRPWRARARADRPRGAAGRSPAPLRRPRPSARRGRARGATAHRRRRLAPRLLRRRRHHDDDLAARLAACGIVARERRQIAAADFLVQLGEFAADRGGARAQPFGQVGKGGGQPLPALEQHQRRRNGRRAPRCAFAAPPVLPAGSLRKRNGRSAVRRHASAASSAEAPGIAVTVWPASCAARTSL